MSNFVFDFCPNSRLATEIPPDEPSAMSMNGWDFTSKPKIPYRPTFKVRLGGLRWYLDVTGTALDIITNPTINAGRLREFYLTHRMWDSFLFNHEYLGQLRVRFNKPVQIPEAKGESNGLIPDFEIELIEESPGY